MSFDKDILKRLEAKFWDFPTDVDEMRIVSYDANYNPLIIEYYFSNKLYYRWPGSTSGWAGGSSLALPSDEWAFVAMVMEPNKVTLRINDETWVDNRSHDPANLGALRLGSGNYSKFNFFTLLWENNRR